MWRSKARAALPVTINPAVPTDAAVRAASTAPGSSNSAPNNTRRRHGPTSQAAPAPTIPKAATSPSGAARDRGQRAGRRGAGQGDGQEPRAPQRGGIGGARRSRDEQRDPGDQGGGAGGGEHRAAGVAPEAAAAHVEGGGERGPGAGGQGHEQCP